MGLCRTNLLYSTFQYSGLFYFVQYEANPNNPIQTPSNRHRAMLQKTGQQSPALRRYDRAAPANRYHNRFRFGRLAVERGLPEAGRILAAGNTLWAVEGCADGRGHGIHKLVQK
jgi:hypothetical protein